MYCSGPKPLKYISHAALAKKKKTVFQINTEFRLLRFSDIPQVINCWSHGIIRLCFHNLKLHQKNLQRVSQHQYGSQWQIRHKVEKFMSKAPICPCSWCCWVGEQALSKCGMTLLTVHKLGCRYYFPAAVSRKQKKVLMMLIIFPLVTDISYIVLNIRNDNNPFKDNKDSIFEKLFVVDFNFSIFLTLKWSQQ